eukprot:CAMPEP_0178955192 /NCGR_PEP_ID=MMETSP0789-20121207/9454_1 /TAXON_ID=3005 /ORGANISM="Rhizosolenia setigera, Strain CCMP 1694" /LENGTH=99 /DNA_ID=CAMNT_0020636767 /DNA_START=85 /DNA_END=380 /DNA_ORIENTATION=+
MKLAIIATLASTVAAFVAPGSTNTHSSTALAAERREFFAGAAAAAAAAITGVAVLPQENNLLISASNPATGQFRGKYKGESFVPGRGMRNREEVLISAS